jgi:hypothetical protein
MRKAQWAVAAVVMLGVIASGCGKDYASTAPQTSPGTSTPGLTAQPPSVTLAVGGSTTVSISGGKPPYAIAVSPDARATAQLVNADSAVATLEISGVSVASPATAVTVRDNSPAPPLTVAVAIKVQ